MRSITVLTVTHWACPTIEHDIIIVEPTCERSYWSMECSYNYGDNEKSSSMFTDQGTIISYGRIKMKVNKHDNPNEEWTHMLDYTDWQAWVVLQPAKVTQWFPTKLFNYSVRSIRLGLVLQWLVLEEWSKSMYCFGSRCEHLWGHFVSLMHWTIFSLTLVVHTQNSRAFTNPWPESPTPCVIGKKKGRAVR